MIWVLLVLGWIVVMIAGISLCRIAAYADSKVRRYTSGSPTRPNEQLVSLES